MRRYWPWRYGPGTNSWINFGLNILQLPFLSASSTALLARISSIQRRYKDRVFFSRPSTTSKHRNRKPNHPKPQFPILKPTSHPTKQKCGATCKEKRKEHQENGQEASLGARLATRALPPLTSESGPQPWPGGSKHNFDEIGPLASRSGTIYFAPLSTYKRMPPCMQFRIRKPKEEGACSPMRRLQKEALRL